MNSFAVIILFCMCHILLFIFIKSILGLSVVMHTIYTFYLLSCAIADFG